MAFNTYQTLFLAVLVLVIGFLLNKHVYFLKRYSIPVPVSGGILVAIVTTIIYASSGLQFTITKEVQTTTMLTFFASIGLSANFRKLIKGGLPLVILLIVAGLLVIAQNAVGVGMASLLGIDKIYGLLAGSITLTGGHGTGAAWAQTFIKDGVNIPALTEVAIASATYGLIIGGIIGGPVAEWLIRRNNLKSTDSAQTQNIENTDLEKISINNLFYAVAAIIISIYVGSTLHTEIKPLGIPGISTLPQFVFVLFCGVVIRVVLDNIFKIPAKDSAVESIGSLGLYFFIACALLGLKLWTIVDLAIPILIILLVQTLFIIAFVILITYYALGRNYDAAVIAGGHVGFGLGATPTAVANMQAVTSQHGPSYKAFLIIPLVGAFFIDLINASVISSFYHFIQ